MQKNNFYILIALFWLPFISHGETLRVCSDCELSTISVALEEANPHDTLLFDQGIYESIDVDLTKPVTLLGQGEVIFDGKAENYVINIIGDSINLRGIKFINSGRSYTKDYAAIYVSKAKHFSVIDCKIENSFFGLLIEKSHHGKIIDNKIIGKSLREDDSGNGIHIWHCSNVEVRNNEVFKMRDGIYFEFVTESDVSQNYSHDNIRYGLHFMFSNNDAYRDNTFTRNGAGVAVMFSKFIEMKNNHFVKNWGTASYGLLLKEIYDAEILDNIFEENTIAIFVEGSSRVNYFNNDFVGNGWALKIAGACYANIFEKNNFKYNAFDVSYSTKLNDNKFDGNYWSSYTGYDLDKDGIGDVPYRPVKLFSYIVNQTPESIVLLRSLFIDIINFSEKVSPVFTPDNLLDLEPLMRQSK